MATTTYAARSAGVALVLAVLLAWPAELLARYRGGYRGASVRQSTTIHRDTRVNRNYGNYNVNRSYNVHRDVDVDVHHHGGWGGAAAGAAVGMATGVAIGTMMARPPAYSTPVVVGGTSYYYHDNAYYRQVVYGGGVQYQVVAAPPGAIITTLPVNCSVTVVGNVSYQQCGATYYQRVPTGYQVVVVQ